jgi:DNA-binding phage protein
MSSPNAFWADLHEQLQGDPDFARQYLLEWVRISTVDRLVNQLEAERSSIGISKAALARAIHRDPAAIRRLLSDTSGNPTVETVSSVAAAMGYKLELVPMDKAEREAVSDPLLELAGA